MHKDVQGVRPSSVMIILIGGAITVSFPPLGIPILLIGIWHHFGVHRSRQRRIQRVRAEQAYQKQYDDMLAAARRLNRW